MPAHRFPKRTTTIFHPSEGAPFLTVRLHRITHNWANKRTSVRANAESTLRWHYHHCCYWNQWSCFRMGCNSVLEWLYLLPLFSMRPVCVDLWCQWDLWRKTKKLWRDPRFPIFSKITMSGNSNHNSLDWESRVLPTVLTCHVLVRRYLNWVLFHAPLDLLDQNLSSSSISRRIRQTAVYGPAQGLYIWGFVRINTGQAG